MTTTQCRHSTKGFRTSSYPVDVVVDDIQTDMVQRIEGWLIVVRLIVLFLLIGNIKLI